MEVRCSKHDHFLDTFLKICPLDTRFYRLYLFVFKRCLRQNLLQNSKKHSMCIITRPKFILWWTNQPSFMIIWIWDPQSKYNMCARKNTHAVSSFFAVLQRTNYFYNFATNLVSKSISKWMKNTCDFLHRNAYLEEIFKETCQEGIRVCYIEFPRT